MAEEVVIEEKPESKFIILKMGELLKREVLTEEEELTVGWE